MHFVAFVVIVFACDHAATILNHGAPEKDAISASFTKFPAMS